MLTFTNKIFTQYFWKKKKLLPDYSAHSPYLKSDFVIIQWQILLLLFG